MGPITTELIYKEGISTVISTSRSNQYGSTGSLSIRVRGVLASTRLYVPAPMSGLHTLVSGCTVYYRILQPKPP